MAEAENGGRDRDRTCDPSRVKGVRYRCATRPWRDLCEPARAPVKRAAGPLHRARALEPPAP